MRLAKALAPFTGIYLYGLLLLAPALLMAVYQVGGHYNWEMGDRFADVYLVDFYGVEHSGNVAFRWTLPRAGLQAPGSGMADGVARLRLNGDSWGGPPRDLTVQINDGPATV